MRVAGVVKLLLFLVAVPSLSLSNLRAELKVFSDFENGSARITAVEQETQTIHFQPAGNPDRGWPCWWSLRVEGADPKRPVTLELQVPRPVMAYDHKQMAAAWAMPERAAFSTNGTVWTQTASGERRGDRITYRVNTPSSTSWLAWGPPFTVRDANAFVKNVAAAQPFASAFELCKSREGHSVPGLRIAEGARAAEERPAIWIIARQHAWEVGGSWVARGIVEWLAGTNAAAAWMRQNTEVFVVPIMDADRVATGDGGKISLPQDHNRDWSDAPHWPEVAAVQKRLLPLMRDKRIALLLDLHNPGATQRNEMIYVTTRSLVTPEVWERQSRFVGFLRAEFPGLVYIDDKWKENDPNDEKVWHTLTTTWLQDRDRTNSISFAIETPWNMPQGTIQGYGEVGRKIGSVMEKYLHENR